MQLRDALDDYKRNAGDDRLFAGERRTVTGRFTGGDGRLVHVDPDGGLRDFGYPLTGGSGLSRSRFGLAVHGDVTWFEASRSRQRYVDDTPLVETVHETDRATVRRYDLTVGDAHLTRATVDPAPDAGLDADDFVLVAYAAFAPDGRDERVGQLRYDDAVEVYHADEHDFLASATGLADLRGQLPPTFPEVLDDAPMDLPRDRGAARYEEERLSGEVVIEAPFEGGTTTVGTLLTDGSETPCEEARGRLSTLFAELDSPEALADAAADTVPTVSASTPERESVVADLRVLSLLSAESGLRIAGPDFDPHYQHSGGYGYTWFRDDAEIATFLLESDDRLGLGLDDWHARSAEMYVETQRPDGSWPHRVWPRNGALAPGWANARIEDGPDVDYQADQTGSVIAFLARARGAGVDVDELDRTLVDALASLDSTLADDGRPVVCQNAWEDSGGRFTHTAATFLEAYGALARHGDGLVDDADRFGGDPAAHARRRAREVYDALDDLWVPDRGRYALRETVHGDLDDRIDSATLALASAHRAYDALGDDGRVGNDESPGAGGVDDERLDRLVSHVDRVVDGLTRETDAVSGLFRYEGDGWRRGDQPVEKVWTVSTAWGAHACGELSALLAARDDPRAERFAERARDLLGIVSPDGPLCEPTGYLPEQFFDDGTPDSATPLGWPHAIRLATVGLLDAHDLLAVEPVPADD
ncbi:hypothetical protein SAMN04488066_103204 [Halorubrum aquaticum]|uniref:Glucoamylase (Glucan-1,4-alpha-glucosidase), GH15 family n=1 Tax=Halorubrum aquaticum TaxID=387340 RepID=A0A1I2ZW99_9EURY|nr:glycoside hydrolase family 15 protein [Halorubrum aquaticum]SFH42107.1 hypothetical protein SAMN04488066_103204 [Halorubrum aquaticum]